MTRTIIDSFLVWVLSPVLVSFISLSPLLADGEQEARGIASEGLSPSTPVAPRINLTSLITEWETPAENAINDSVLV